MARRKKPVTVSVPAEAFAKIAAEVVPGHAGWLASGYTLNDKGRMWRRKNGSWTGRFVYAKGDEPGLSTIFTVRGIVFAP